MRPCDARGLYINKGGEYEKDRSKRMSGVLFGTILFEDVVDRDSCMKVKETFGANGTRNGVGGGDGMSSVSSTVGKRDTLFEM